MNEIAVHENIPPVYLRKLLGELRRKRIIRSVKGMHGGYLLAREPKEVTLWDVFVVLDPNPYLDECVLCHTNDSSKGCAFCGDWARIGSDLIELLQRKTIADFASSLN